MRLVLSFSLVFCVSAELTSHEQIRFDSKCPVYSCLPVSAIIHEDIKIGAVQGRLNNQPFSRFSVSNLYSGSQQLALAGFSNSGSLVFFTNKGLFESADKRIRIQCRACLQTRFKKRQHSFFLPAVDLQTVGLLPESVSIWPSGNQYLAYQQKCVQVDKGKLFEVVLNKYCDAYRLSAQPGSLYHWKNQDLSEMDLKLINH